MSTERPFFDTWLRPIGAIAFLALVLVIIGQFGSSAHYTLQRGVSDPKGAHELFAKDIQVSGGKEAYAHMAAAIADMGIDDQHGYAHIFGRELYRIEGEAGIAVCDVRFGLGCFHQFLGNAIEDMGTSSVERLFKTCGTVTGSSQVCEHGLGHGIVSGLGYSEENLRDALSLCTSVTHQSAYAGCSGGAFMEYNMRTIAIAEGTMPVRSAEHGDMYAPCNAFTGDEQRTCVFWMPEWWYFGILRAMSPNDPQSSYAQMGRLCAQTAAPQSCYEGIGYVTPTAFGFEAAPAREACDAVGSAGHGNVYCRGMAGLIFHITVGEEHKAALMCDGLGDNDRVLCMKYATYRGNDFSFSVPETL